MSRTILAKYVTPWKFRREQEARRVAALRQRDGDDWRDAFRTRPDQYQGYRAEQSIKHRVSVGVTVGNN